MFSKIIVHTFNTVRLKKLLDSHVKRRKPIMFIGSAGTGKTTVFKDYLSETSRTECEYAIINLNSYTTSLSL